MVFGLMDRPIQDEVVHQELMPLILSDNFIYHICINHAYMKNEVVMHLSSQNTMCIHHGHLFYLKNYFNFYSCIILFTFQDFSEREDRFSL